MRSKIQKMSLRATNGSAAIQKCMDCFVALLLAMTIVSSANAEEENISPVCQVLATHVPADDVAYKAGVDVNGNAVVPADLNAQPFTVPDVIKVLLDMNLAERIPNVADGIELKAPLGMLEIHSNGTVRYNGEDWTAPVMTLCGQSHKVMEEPETQEVKAPAIEEKPQSKPSGQASEDVIKSEDDKTVPEAVEVEAKEPIVPKEVNIGQIEVDPPVEDTVTEESDIIEGGEYREIYINE